MNLNKPSHFSVLFIFSFLTYLDTDQIVFLFLLSPFSFLPIWSAGPYCLLRVARVKKARRVNLNYEPHANKNNYHLR